LRRSDKNVVVDAVTLEFLTDRLDLAEQLLAGRKTMFTPQDLPGRYGRVVKAIDHVLEACNIRAVLGGGWAVWHHGFIGRITQDVEIVLPRDSIEGFLRVAAVAGFEELPQPVGRWPKLRHRGTGVQVDILPEGERPGTVSNPAPTTIRHPLAMGAGERSLEYISLPCLIELKLAAGRVRDEADVTELLRANLSEVEAIRRHLTGIHTDYVQAFDRLLKRAREQRDE
jgi:hypothetical protein